MRFLKQLPKEMKYLEILSRAFLLCLPVSVVFASVCDCEIYFFYKNIMSVIWIIPLVSAVVLEVISISLHRKKNLSIKQPLRNFLKFLLLAGLLSGVVSILLFAPCISRLKARDARIKANIYQTREIMTSVYKRNGNYDNFNCEQEDMTNLCQDIDGMYVGKPFLGLKCKVLDSEDGGEPTIVHDRLNNSQAACIYSPLNTKKDFWYCADSTGKAGVTEINPGTSGYCVGGGSAVCP